MWGALTGCMIAAYTLVDGYSVKTLLLSSVLVDYAENLFRTVAFSGRACRDRIGIVNEYRKYWRESLAISVLTPIGYILVLFAMKRAPISRVAPVREMSMIIGAYLGTKFLKEGYGVRRFVGATLIAGGVAALTAG